MPPKHWIEARRLARAIRRRMTEHDHLHGRTVKIDSEISKILANEDAEPGDESIQNPGVFTLREIAGRLGTTVGDLLGEVALGDDDRKRIEMLVGFLVERFRLFSDPHAVEERPIPTDEAGFVEREYGYPRKHHAWLLRTATYAARVAGRESEESEVELTEVLHSVRDVENKRMQVIRVIGNSMANAFEHDDKVLVDTYLRSPRNGDVVAVYIHNEGGVLGYWRAERGEFWLDKENEVVSSIRLGGPGEWTLWGTVTRIVDKPVLARRRLAP
jgi:Peptidase S24-like